MDSFNFFFIFSFGLITLSWFDAIQAAEIDDKEHDKKYIPYDEILDILKTFKDYNTSDLEYGVLLPTGNELNVFGLPTTILPQYAKTLGSDNVDEAVKLYFYTPEVLDGILFDLKTLKNLSFNPANPTKIICHGWMSGHDASVVKDIAAAYLKKGNLNVIGVDWSTYSDDILYPMSVTSTQKVGSYLGDIIDAIVEEYAAQYKDFHIIGHSLGAHVAGFAGNCTKEKIGRITGLDPALPGFQYIQGRDGRLDDTDATFVDVIHTCSGVLGMSVPVGHVDFFPNGGSPFQPGCLSVILPMSNSCSHGRSHQYFAESINEVSKFIGVSCEDWKHFKNQKCEEIFVPMGEDVPQDVRGIFYLRTNDHSPFGQGLDGTNY